MAEGVCSQVAEMSLDLSADLLVTDLAPAPALIQRLGRLNRRAEDGDPTAMRLCMERMNPTGANRPLALELPPVKGADDAEAAVRLVLDAFGSGEISIKELTHMLAAVDRLVRVGENIVQMRYSEKFRREADQGDWELHNAFPPYHDTPNADALAAGRCICPCRRQKLVS